jgi:hypothetical protein
MLNVFCSRSIIQINNCDFIALDQLVDLINCLAKHTIQYLLKMHEEGRNRDQTQSARKS